jgi:hypothetical protein
MTFKPTFTDRATPPPQERLQAPSSQAPRAGSSLNSSLVDLFHHRRQDQVPRGEGNQGRRANPLHAVIQETLRLIDGGIEDVLDGLDALPAPSVVNRTLLPTRTNTIPVPRHPNLHGILHTALNTIDLDEDEEDDPLLLGNMPRSNDPQQ